MAVLIRKQKSHLIRRGVLEQQHSFVLQKVASRLGNEEVGTLNDVFESGCSIWEKDFLHVASVDGFRAASARNEEVGLKTMPDMEVISEVHPISYDLAIANVLVTSVDADEESIIGQQLGIKVLHHASPLGQVLSFHVDKLKRPKSRLLDSIADSTYL